MRLQRSGIAGLALSAAATVCPPNLTRASRRDLKCVAVSIAITAMTMLACVVLS